MPHGHRTAELRSLAYHRLVAERLERDPEGLERDPEVLLRARGRVASWVTDGGPAHPVYARRWQAVLERQVAEIVRILADDDEASRDLRQNTPFAGVLTSEERWRVIREVGREKEPSASNGRSSST